MSIRLDARHIFNSSTSKKHNNAVKDFCEKDCPKSIEIFKKYVNKTQKKTQAKDFPHSVEIFKNGSDNYDKNILMLAAKNANVSLIKYIVENADPKILDLRDKAGRTALHCLLYAKAPLDKIITCARILIEAGADMHTEMYTSEGDLEDPLGCLLFSVEIVESEAHKYSAEEKQQLRDLLDLFVSHGAATHAYCRGAGRLSVNDDMNETLDGGTEHLKKVAYLKELKNSRARVEEKLGLRAKEAILDAKHIFNRSKTKAQNAAVMDFCGKDCPNSVEKFKKYVKEEGEFKDGVHCDKNILMIAARFANLNLMKYIVEHADPKILNLRDKTGMTALHYVLLSTAPMEKIIECARILIEAGADMNACDGKDFSGEDPLGYALRSLCVDTSEDSPLDSMQKMRELVDLFVSHGATYAYCQDVGPISFDDHIDGGAKHKEKAAYLEELKNSRARVEEKFWLKAKELVNGCRDQHSQLFQMPQDLQNLLLQKIWVNS